MAISGSLAARLPAVLALVSLSLIWGYNFVMMKQVVAFVDPFTFTAARTMLGAVTLFVFARIAGIAMPVPPLKLMLWLGLLQTAAFGLLIQWALVGGAAGRTVMVVYSMPFWLIALASIFLHERLGKDRIAVVFAAALGLVLILQPWAVADMLGGGGLLALLAGFTWGVAGIITRLSPRRPGESVLALTAWQMLFGAVLLCVLAPILASQPVNSTPFFWLALFYCSVFATGVAWFLWLFILDRMSVAEAGLSSLLVPIIGLAAGWLQLGERPDAVTGTGIALILLALFSLATINITKRRQARK